MRRVVLVLLVCAGAARAETWRDPDGSGVSAMLPAAEGWEATPPRAGALNGAGLVGKRVPGGARVAVVITRSDLPSGVLDDEAVAGFERGLAGEALQTVETVRFLLDGRPALRMVAHGVGAGRPVWVAAVVLLEGQRLFETEAMSRAGDPFRDAELARFLMSLRAPPVEPVTVMRSAELDLAVAVPSGGGWSVPGGVPLEVRRGAERVRVLVRPGGDVMDEAAVPMVDALVYGEAGSRKLSGALFPLADGRVAYCTTGERGGVGVAAVVTMGGGRLYAVTAEAPGNPLAVPALNRALFSLEVR